MEQSDFLRVDVVPNSGGVFIIRDGHKVEIPYTEIPALIKRLERSLPDICLAYAHEIYEGGEHGG